MHTRNYGHTSAQSYKTENRASTAKCQQQCHPIRNMINNIHPKYRRYFSSVFPTHGVNCLVLMSHGLLSIHDNNVYNKSRGGTHAIWDSRVDSDRFNKWSPPHLRVALHVVLCDTLFRVVFCFIWHLISHISG